jgi:hypothetical protein
VGFNTEGENKREKFRIKISKKLVSCHLKYFDRNRLKKGMSTAEAIAQ